METKDLILEIALDMFSKRGFDSTPVRDIADQVGIKDSSLYFHFKNKRAILEALTESFIHDSEYLMSFMAAAVQTITDMTDDQFLLVTERYVSSYLLNDPIRKFMGVMALEQRNDESMRKSYVEWCIEKPIQFQTSLFEKLQSIGYLKKGEAYQMAITYYAPLFLFYQQYINPECTERDKQQFSLAVMQSAKNFLSLYKEAK